MCLSAKSSSSTVKFALFNRRSFADEQSSSSATQIEPTYKGTEFHRVIPGFMAQAGDFECFDGTGGFCVSNANQNGNRGGNLKFADENFLLKHDSPGVLSMANSGRNTNGSQFFITFASVPHLDGKHVVFGKVVKGFREVILSMERVETDPSNDRPLSMQRIIITDCGIGKGPVGTLSRNASNSMKKGELIDSKGRSRRKRKKGDRHTSKKRSYSSLSDCSDSSSEHDRRSHSKRERKNDRRHNRRRSHSSSDSGSCSYDRKRDRKHKHNRSKKSKYRHDSHRKSKSRKDRHRSHDNDMFTDTVRRNEDTQNIYHEKVSTSEHASSRRDDSNRKVEEEVFQQDRERHEHRKRSMVPMRKDEYESEQSKVYEVYDPESGRIRLVRGTGEIIERIVSRDQHDRINKIATASDGRSFSRAVSSIKK